jgi:hypothetical protein
VDCDDADASVYPGADEVCRDGMDNNCNGKIDRKDKACARNDDEELDDEDLDDEDLDDEDLDDGEVGDGDRERNYRLDNYSEEQQNVRDLEALQGALSAGCAVIPESMGHGSPGGMFFMYSIVAGYIGFVRTLARRRAGTRKERLPGTGEKDPIGS